MKMQGAGVIEAIVGQLFKDVVESKLNTEIGRLPVLD
jgi:hypothetical protein